MRIAAIILISIAIYIPVLYADTIFMKDKSEIKGLIVDEYVDRVILSTVDGEKEVFREDIERINYDTEEQNFMQLGKAYEAKRLYRKAASYYKKAMEVNPDYEEAREAYLASQAKIWRQGDALTKREIERQTLVRDWSKGRVKENLPLPKDKKDILKDTLGISLAAQDGIFIIDDVRPYSSADKAGIEAGDVLAGIWGRFTSHRTMDDIVDELLGPEHSEVKVSLEKEISIPIKAPVKNLYKELGVLLRFEYEGLTVDEVAEDRPGRLAGLKEGDLVMAIDKESTRYLPMDQVTELINKTNNRKEITFHIRRDLNLRR